MRQRPSAWQRPSAGKTWKPTLIGRLTMVQVGAVESCCEMSMRVLEDEPCGQALTSLLQTMCSKNPHSHWRQIKCFGLKQNIYL